MSVMSSQGPPLLLRRSDALVSPNLQFSFACSLAKRKAVHWLIFAISASVTGVVAVDWQMIASRAKLSAEKNVP